MASESTIQPTASAKTKPINFRALLMRKEAGTFLLLVILCVVVAVLNPRFLAGANLQNMARLIGAFGIFSIGVGIVIITGGIDLSVGSIMALLGVLLSIALTE